MKFFKARTLIMATFSIVFSSYAHDLRVKNHTPFMIEAKCKKVGATKNVWVTIAPGQRKKVGCGAADCHNGIKVKINAAEEGWRDIEIKSDWKMRCESNDVDIILIPKFKEGEIGADALFVAEEYTLAVVRSMEELDIEIPFECKQK